jgi:hypothetical protein
VAEPDQIGECKCGVLSRLADDSTCPIKFDPPLNEYHVTHTVPDGSGYTVLRFCPFCGGGAPKSHRGGVGEKPPRLLQSFQHHQSRPNVIPPEPEPQIDVSKRYDIYCFEAAQKMVVYRNALFKSVGSLLTPPGNRPGFPQFVEVEQANGQSVFISRSSVFRFCAPGTELVAEPVAPK